LKKNEEEQGLCSKKICLVQRKYVLFKENQKHEFHEPLQKSVGLIVPYNNYQSSTNPVQYCANTIWYSTQSKG